MNSNFKKLKFKTFLETNPRRIFEGGRRFTNFKSKNDGPLISIITVVKNKSKYVQETINSIKDQKYNNIEYLVIDGVSTDGTFEILKNNIDFIFGSVKKHWGIINGYYPRKIKYSWFFYTSHSTGFFIKRNAAEINGKYSLKYKYSSDFDYFYRLIVHNKFKGIATKKNEIFGIFRPGGISATLNKEDHFFEKIQIRIDNKQNKYYLFILFFVKILKNLFSDNKISFKKFYFFFRKNFI